MQEEALSRNECVGIFTRMTDGDLFRWLEDSEIGFVRDYASRIRYRKLFKVVLSKPIASFEKDTQKRFLETFKNITKLIEVESEISEDPGDLIVDVISPPLGEKKLGKIPLLVGGEQGFDIVNLEDTKEGRPLMHILRQQSRTIPSVRVYSDPQIANDVRRRFDKAFPVSDTPTYREDEHDFTEY